MTLTIPNLDGTAACTEVGQPDLWFPDQGDTGAAARAKRVCAGCPVREQCLTWAITTNERGGIWGGCGEKERDKIRTEKFGDGTQNRRALAAVRRAEILRLSREGLGAKAIADRLAMGESTVLGQRAALRKAGKL